MPQPTWPRLPSACAAAAYDRRDLLMRRNSLNEPVQSSCTNSDASSAVLKSPHSAPHPTRPPIAVSSLGGFRTPAPAPADPFVHGRYPKPFTKPEILKMRICFPVLTR